MPLIQVASALLPVPGLDARKLSISYMSTGASDVKFLREGQPRRHVLSLLHDPLPWQHATQRDLHACVGHRSSDLSQ